MKKEDEEREIQEYLEWLASLGLEELRTEARPAFDSTLEMDAVLSQGRLSVEEAAYEHKYKGRHRS